MKVLILFLLSIIGIRIQLTFFQNFLIIDFPLLFSLLYTLKNKPSYGIFFSTFLGIVSDYTFGYPLGLYGFSLTFTSYLAFQVYKKLYIQSKFFLFLFFFTSHGLFNLVFFILTKFFNIYILRDIFLSFLISGFFNSIILTFVFGKK